MNKARALRTDEMGPRTSEGTRLLWLVLAKKDWSQNRLALELGREGARAKPPLKISSGPVNRWLHGFKVPNLRWALILDALLDIDPHTWNQPPKRPIVLRLGKAA
jgi:hypothetical protein